MSALPKAIYLASLAAMFLVRAPHIRRTLSLGVATHRESALDRSLVALVSIGLVVLPLLWLATPLLAFADHPTHPLALTSGVLALAVGLWILHRSHDDLGPNWSNTLEIREKHALVTRGIYRHLRHPMYLALLLHGIGQALVLPNWVAGSSFLAAFAVLVLCRLGPEEKMMVDAFGDAYAQYAGRTKRLVPGVF